MLGAGSCLGSYKILAPLGAGGMGGAFRAHDSRLGRAVAIKMLSPHLTSAPEVRARFEREARTIAQLDPHPICASQDPGVVRPVELAEEGPAAGGRSVLAGYGVAAAPSTLNEFPTVSRPLTAEGDDRLHVRVHGALEGKEADARTDLWAPGCVLYAMATGKAGVGRRQSGIPDRCGHG